MNNMDSHTHKLYSEKIQIQTVSRECKLQNWGALNALVFTANVQEAVARNRRDRIKTIATVLKDFGEVAGYA